MEIKVMDYTMGFAFRESFYCSGYNNLIRLIIMYKVCKWIVWRFPKIAVQSLYHLPPEELNTMNSDDDDDVLCMYCNTTALNSTFLNDFYYFSLNWPSTGGVFTYLFIAVLLQL